MKKKLSRDDMTNDEWSSVSKTAKLLTDMQSLKIHLFAFPRDRVSIRLARKIEQAERIIGDELTAL